MGRSARDTVPAVTGHLLSSEDIRRGLRRLNGLATAANVTVDLAVDGGAAMVLAFDARAATKDVDAVVRGKVGCLRKAMAEVAEAEGSPSDWMNDGVKGLLSTNEDMVAMRESQGSPCGGLRVCMATPEYLFAMKRMAMRSASDGSSGDIADIKTLASLAEIMDAGTALDIVASFYPAHLIPPKVRFGVEEIMETLAGNDGPP